MRPSDPRGAAGSFGRVALLAVVDHRARRDGGDGRRLALNRTLFGRVRVAEEDEEEQGVHAVEKRSDVERKRQTGVVEEIAGNRRAGC